MFEEGVIKEDGNGNYVPVLDPNEKAHIKTQITESKKKAQMEAAQQQNQIHDDPNADVYRYGLE